MKKIKFTGRLSIIVLVFILAALPGCSKKEQTENNETVSGEDVKKEAKEAYEATGEYTQQQIQDFWEQMETRLTDYGKKIDLLQAKTEDLKGDARSEADQQLAELRQKYGDVYDKINELKNSGSGAWSQLKSGIDAAMEDLGDAYQKAAGLFLTSDKMGNP